MLVTDFDYELPEQLIAQCPPSKRGATRLLAVDVASGARVDSQFSSFCDFLRAGDLLVFNDTRVIPARLYGRKQGGGRVEVLIERIVTTDSVLAHVRNSRSLREGDYIFFDDASSPVKAELMQRVGDLLRLRFSTEKGDQVMLDKLLDEIGEIPLPPYIKRKPDGQDEQRYQTIYARHPGAIAAPTAGLHFDEAMMEKLDAHGVNRAFITLHVGSGTFQPVRVDQVEDHHIHQEYAEVSAEVCHQIKQTRAQGGRVIAVGTTVVRTLEWCSRSGLPQPFQGETELFIYPGYTFKCIDAMLTNFHLPKSTLLMLVAAFGGQQHIFQAYRHAVAAQYRFFSYGDAMFLSRPNKS